MNNRQKVGVVILFMPVLSILIAGMVMEDTRPVAIAISLVLFTILTSIIGATLIFKDKDVK